MNSQLVGRRILLVEDEMLIACMLGDMLAELGCAVIGPAARVAQALAVIEAEIIDAAVLDISLNQELSYPVADALIARRIPFLFSTGYDRSRVWPGYQSLPMLQKPFHLRELTKVLATFFPATEPLPKVAA